MWSFVAITVISGGASLGLGSAAARLGRRVGAIDNPGLLSIHSRPTPRTGGLAIFAALVIATCCSLVAILPARSTGASAILTIVGLAALVATIGFLDDRGTIPTIVEVSLLVVPAFLLTLVGTRVGFLPAAWARVVLTMFYIVGGCSAMNLIDGMDGLAASVAAIASFFFAILCYRAGDQVGLILSLALMGAVLGFLPHNLRRANIFMGDNGSLFVGFILAVVAVRLTSKLYDFPSFAAPILVLGVPVADTFLAIVRRLVRRREVLSGDRGHVYDLLRARGVTDRKTVLAMAGIAATGGVTGLLASRLDALPALLLFVGWFVGFFALAVWLGMFKRPAGDSSLGPSLHSGQAQNDR